MCSFLEKRSKRLISKLYEAFSTSVAAAASRASLASAHRVQESSSPLMAATEVMVAASWYKLLQRELAASAHN